MARYFPLGYVHCVYVRLVDCNLLHQSNIDLNASSLATGKK